MDLPQRGCGYLRMSGVSINNWRPRLGSRDQVLTKRIVEDPYRRRGVAKLQELGQVFQRIVDRVAVQAGDRLKLPPGQAITQGACKVRDPLRA